MVSGTITQGLVLIAREQQAGEREEKEREMTSKLDHLQDANFPRDPEGRVYHLGVKRGEGMYFLLFFILYVFNAFYCSFSYFKTHKMVFLLLLCILKFICTLYLE